jgi:hypothetical protein
VAHSLVPPSVEGHVNRVRDIAPKYWKGASDLTVRNRLTFYIMNRYGRMSFNARSHSQGVECEDQAAAGAASG